MSREHEITSDMKAFWVRNLPQGLILLQCCDHIVISAETEQTLTAAFVGCWPTQSGDLVVIKEYTFYYVRVVM